MKFNEKVVIYYPVNEWDFTKNGNTSTCFKIQIIRLGKYGIPVEFELEILKNHLKNLICRNLRSLLKTPSRKCFFEEKICSDIEKIIKVKLSIKIKRLKTIKARDIHVYIDGVHLSIPTK